MVHALSLSLQVEKMNVFLEETQLCNCMHPMIQDIAHQITDTRDDETEKARKIFFYIRDHVRFALGGGGFKAKASRTVQARYGDCATKTNVHIALLRAVGIPARMRSTMVQVSFLKDILPGVLYRVSTKCYTKDFHFWAECYLCGRWISCDSLLDKAFYEGGLQKGLFTKKQIPSIVWNGNVDLLTLEEWKTKDMGCRPSWDDWHLEYKKVRMPVPRMIDGLVELFVTLWMAPLCCKQTDQVRTPST